MAVRRETKTVFLVDELLSVSTSILLPPLSLNSNIGDGREPLPPGSGSYRGIC